MSLEFSRRHSSDRLNTGSNQLGLRGLFAEYNGYIYRHVRTFYSLLRMRDSSCVRQPVHTPTMNKEYATAT